LFRGRQSRGAAQAQLEQEVERLKSPTAEQIAVELIGLVEPCGLDPDAIPVGALAKCLVPGNGRPRAQLVEQFWGLLDEGALALVRVGLSTSAGCGGTGDGNVCGLSRAGREALAAGSVEQALGGDATVG
jgi:hypothetical protein